MKQITIILLDHEYAALERLHLAFCHVGERTLDVSPETTASTALARGIREETRLFLGAEAVRELCGPAPHASEASHERAAA
jgi:hypothetical protein